MGGLNRDEFGQAVDQVLPEQVCKSDVRADEHRAVAGWDDEGVGGVEPALFPNFVRKGFGAVKEKGIPNVAGVKVRSRRALNGPRRVFACAGDFVKPCPIALNLREFCRRRAVGNVDVAGNARPRCISRDCRARIAR